MDVHKKAIVIQRWCTVAFASTPPQRLRVSNIVPSPTALTSGTVQLPEFAAIASRIALFSGAPGFFRANIPDRTTIAIVASITPSSSR